LIKQKKKIMCLNDGRIYDGVPTAAIVYNINKGCIYDHLKGRKPHVHKVHKLKFAYID
jgi:hypothetical protein